MKLPRDVSGFDLGKALRILGYERTRQRGSHVRYTTHTTQRNGEHHVVIPDHNPMKIGTFHGILKGVATHHRISVEELVRLLELCTDADSADIRPALPKELVPLARSHRPVS